MEQDLTQKISRSAMRKKIRILTVVAVLSVSTAVLAILACAVLFVHFTYQGTALATFGEHSSKYEKENTPGEVTVEVMSDTVYTQEEVDKMVTEAMNNRKPEEDSQVLEMLQERLVEGDGTMSIFRDLYPDHIVMLDSGQYYFIERDDALAVNTYNTEWFVPDENGFVNYTVGYKAEDGVLPEEDESTAFEDEAYFEGETYKGIDVSKFQGEIDWEQVKEAGIDYAIIRVGIRGYTEGLIVEDEYFKQNIEGALAADIPVGVYFFTAAVNAQEAEEEAQFVIDMLQGYEVDYPVYLDIEDVKSPNCRTNQLTKEERTDLAEIFLNKVAEAGYKPGLYGNLKTYMLMLDLSRLEQYDKWLAAYTLPAYYPYEYKMLQYSEKGRVPGISTAVDLNISFKDYTEE
ncbi:MAG: hypothetical protein E7299_06725 [Lachnospiraceae bacterium]|nr:hypothetical protein [Lachnospiraceae bacterium]